MSPLIGSGQAYSGKVSFTLILHVSWCSFPTLVARCHIPYQSWPLWWWVGLTSVICYSHTVVLRYNEPWSNWVYHHVFGFYCLWKPPLQEAGKKIILLKWLLDTNSEWMTWMVKPSVAGFLKVCDIIENVSCAVSLKEVGYLLFTLLCEWWSHLLQDSWGCATSSKMLVVLRAWKK